MSEELRISVRSLVEFVLRSGDLDNRMRTIAEDAMSAGSKMHRKLQDSAGPEYLAEVPLKHTHVFPEDGMQLTVEGRADGIYLGTVPGEEESDVLLPVIDEIKSTYADVMRMKEPEAVHLAQARCYAYIYLIQNQFSAVIIRMTYASLDTDDVRFFYERMSSDEITQWFLSLMEEYHKWAAFAVQWIRTRTESVKTLAFPFEYRPGQKELMAHCYRTIVHGRKLFLEAPTGSGKTLAVLYPGIKAMGEGKIGRIFYLTAKNVTGQVAEEGISLLRQGGMRLKSVRLTARDKVCVLEKPNCNPDACPRARGHYDRINEAIYHLLTGTDSFSREAILEYAVRYQVCPFEMALDMSLFSDAVICDYNYVFDPHAYLRRFFEGESSRDFLFLVDEAHNLVDRGRDMYSAVLSRQSLMSMARAVKGKYGDLYRRLSKLSRDMLAMKKAHAGSGSPEEPMIYSGLPGLFDGLFAANTAVYRILENENRKQRRRRRKKPSPEEEALQEELLQFYFDLNHILLIHDLVDEHYLIFGESGKGAEYTVKLSCMDPGANLKRCMDKGRASVLFSATLLPIQYYKKLLGGTSEDYEVYAQSSFDPERRRLLVINDVTSRYTRRGSGEYARIAEGISSAVSQRHGNYLVFFPSYSFMRSVLEIYEERCSREDTSVLVQEPGMTEPEREEFLGRFKESADDHSLVGFGVLGGVFSEGIDLKGDELIGVAVVGTGVPQVCTERELLKRYFDGTGVNGYDYAYRFPGMNKVLQAAGRVIRTSSDVGIVALMDERFLTPGYLKLFPREWQNFSSVSTEEIGGRVSRFWDSWL